jgi:hypothetical protein
MNAYEWVISDREMVVIVPDAESVEAARELAASINLEGVAEFCLENDPDEFPEAGEAGEKPVYVLDEITSLEIWPETGSLA